MSADVLEFLLKTALPVILGAVGWLVVKGTKAKRTDDLFERITKEIAVRNELLKLKESNAKRAEQLEAHLEEELGRIWWGNALSLPKERYWIPRFFDGQKPPNIAAVIGWFWYIAGYVLCILASFLFLILFLLFFLRLKVIDWRAFLAYLGGGPVIDWRALFALLYVGGGFVLVTWLAGSLRRLAYALASDRAQQQKRPACL